MKAACLSSAKGCFLLASIAATDILLQLWYLLYVGQFDFSCIEGTLAPIKLLVVVSKVQLK